ncbi:MAG: RlmE family RNA methyltransferase [Gammaproteobacteria bacterium]
MTRPKSCVWIHQHINDPYVKQAQKDGYRSRAAYKIKEIQEKHKLIKPGMTVLDLGAAPGSWSALVVNWVGKKGKVFALDLLPIDPISGVECLQGDIQDPVIAADLKDRMAGEMADVVLSDIAPNISGNSSVDASRSAYLWDMALEVANDFLKEGGVFCIKVFQGAGFDAYVKKLRQQYATVQIYKPKASRSRSSEVYLIAKQKRAAEPSTNGVTS